MPTQKDWILGLCKGVSRKIFQAKVQIFSKKRSSRDLKSHQFKENSSILQHVYSEQSNISSGTR